MWSAARRIAYAALVLTGCAGSVEPDREYGNGTDPSNAGLDGDGGTTSMDGTDTGNDGPGTDGSDSNGSDSNGTDGNGTDSNGTDGNGTDGVVATPGNPADTCDNGTEALTTGLSIREIALYQTVKITLAENGQWVSSREIPVVQGKKSLVRVFVDPQAGYSPHAVLGVLTLENGGTPKYVTAELTATTSSSDASTSSTFNFQVDGADLGPSTGMSVALVEKSCPSQLGSASTARFPASGTQALGAEKIGKLRVVVVPVNLNGRTPDVSATQLERVRQAMLAYYPVPDVEVSADDVLSWPYSVSANGGGWSDLLNAIIEERASDNAPDDTYYYGMIAPSASFRDFCGFGCVLGLAPQNSGGWGGGFSPDQQAGLGVGFANEDETLTTIVHEIGHAHGRGHAPCGGAQGVDSGFPYNDGSTGDWGWDSRDGSLMPPTSKDIMGYCTPVWIGAYTYGELADRCSQVNSARRYTPADAPEWQNLVLYANGAARWGTMRTRRLPGGEMEDAQVLDASGRVIATTQVVRTTLSHSDDAILYIPTRKAGWAKLVLSDRTIALDAVARPHTR